MFEILSGILRNLMSNRHLSSLLICNKKFSFDFLSIMEFAPISKMLFVLFGFSAFVIVS